MLVLLGGDFSYCVLREESLGLRDAYCVWRIASSGYAQGYKYKGKKEADSSGILTVVRQVSNTSTGRVTAEQGMSNIEVNFSFSVSSVPSVANNK